MSRRKEREPEPGLFDLPLDGPVTEAPEGEPEPAAAPRRPAGPHGRPGPRVADREPEPSLPLVPSIPPVPPVETVESVESRAFPELDAESSAGPPRRVTLSARFLAGLADLAVHLALAVTLLFGARLLGVPVGVEDAPALLVFLLIFSFLYTVIPLAFWGRTPGMAWAGLAARTPAGESLTFGQTALRWLGGILTVLLLGLPVLPAPFTGRSLADYLSGSVVAPA